MKYLKLFENYKKEIHHDTIYYFFNIDELNFSVSFIQAYVNKLENTYERIYKTITKENEFAEVNKNAYEIIRNVTNITNLFLEEYKPNILIIDHIKSSKDTEDKNIMNLRAKLNYKFLNKSNITNNYNFNYFNDTMHTSTILILSKKITRHKYNKK